MLSFAILYLLIFALASVSTNYILLNAAFIGWNISIIALLTTGIALYLYGYLKREATTVEATKSALLGFILILWGALTYLAAAIILSDQINRSMNGAVALTIWDYMEFWLWELKAIFWVGTGIMLIATSLLQIRARRNQNIQKTQTFMP